jgi:hypothetical protein
MTTSVCGGSPWADGLNGAQRLNDLNVLNGSEATSSIDTHDAIA